MFQSFSKLLRGGSRAASFSLISVNCRLLMKESLPPFSKVNPVSSVKGLVYLGYWKQSGFYPMFWMPNVNFLLKLSNSLKTVFLYILKLLKQIFTAQLFRKLFRNRVVKSGLYFQYGVCNASLFLSPSESI